MTQTAEDWAVQVSIKHGPSDERGNPLFMTNIRGKNSAEVLAHVSELAALGGMLHTDIRAFLAVEALAQDFQVASVAPAATAPAPTPAAQTPASATPGSYSNGQVVAVCPVNPNARHRFKEGTNKNGKAWKAIMCSNTPECAVQFM